MAQFQTPQFIEREAKVIGPLTFRRAGYVGAPLVIIFMLWFAIAQNYFIIFILASVLLEGAGVILAFMKVGSKSVPEFLMNALFFTAKPKAYVWQRGHSNLRFKEEKFVNPLDNGEGLQKAELVRKSRVADLAVKVQTKQ